jgi:hypothetical protein
MDPFLLLGLYVSVLVVGAVIYFIREGLRWKDNFNRRFLPISDAEFVGRCPPGTRPEVALKVRRIVAECLGVEYERVYPSTRFFEDLGAD